MDMLIIVLVVAAIAAYFVFGRRGGSSTPAPAGGAPLGSYQAYRQTSPSNMHLGKPTCNRCGSSFVDTAAAVASCRNCGAALYRN